MYFTLNQKIFPFKLKRYTAEQSSYKPHQLIFIPSHT